mgnify:CR=1 FL=1
MLFLQFWEPPHAFQWIPFWLKQPELVPVPQLINIPTWISKHKHSQTRQWLHEQMQLCLPLGSQNRSDLISKCCLCCMFGCCSPELTLPLPLGPTKKNPRPRGKSNDKGYSLILPGSGARVNGCSFFIRTLLPSFLAHLSSPFYLCNWYSSKRNGILQTESTLIIGTKSY